MVDLLEGMWVTLRYDMALARPGKPKELYTEEYPRSAPPGGRGAIAARRGEHQSGLGRDPLHLM